MKKLFTSIITLNNRCMLFYKFGYGEYINFGRI